MTPTVADLRRYRDDPLAFLADLRLPVTGAPRLGDCWADFQVEALRALTPSILAVAAGRIPPVDRVWLERTKGASKDGDVAAMLLWALAFSARPLEMRAGASDFDQVNELRKSIVGLLRVNEWLRVRVDPQRYRVLNTETGSVVEFLTSDASGSHGSRPDITILNELSHGVEQDFASTLLDDADKVAGSLVILATNAGHVNTWQHQWRESLREQAETDPSIFFQKVSDPAPWISSAKLEAARRRNSPSRFARLWAGTWTSGGGDAIPEEHIQRAIVLPGPEYAPAAGSVYGAAVDLAVRRDKAAVVVVGTEPGGGSARVVHVQTWGANEGRDIDLRAIRETVLRLYRTFHLAAVAIDPWQGVLLLQDLRPYGVPIVECPFVPKNLDLMARAMLSGFADNHVQLFPEPELLAGLRSLSVRETRDGFGQRLVAPRTTEAGHADAAVALSMILPAMLEAAIGEPPRPDPFGGNFLRWFRRIQSLEDAISIR